MKNWPWLAVLLLAVAGCGHSAQSADEAEAKPTVDVSVATATRGDIEVTITATGTLAPLPDQEAKIAPLAPGRIKQVFVKTGDSIAKGQLVATLDPGAATGQVQQAQAAVRVAESTLNQARINLTSQTRSQSAAIEQAKLNVNAQRIALAKLRAGSRPQEVAQAQASVASAEAALTAAQQNLSRSQTLFTQGLLARKDLEAAQTQEQTARASLISAQQALSMAKQGNRLEDIRAGEVALSQAEQQLRAAESQSIQNASKAEDVRIAEGQLNAARGALQSALAQSRALAIRSPVSGTIVGRTVNPGEAVDVTTAIATVVNLDRVRVILGVPSDQIGQIRRGDLVTFTADAEPGVVHDATVTVVNRAVDPQTNAVQVEAVVSNPGHTLRDDGFVKATIAVQRHSGVVLVPAGAVVDKDGKSTVFVAGSDNIAHAKELEVGARNGKSVEVRSGLSAGTKVITTGAFELEDGTQIKVQK